MAARAATGHDGEVIDRPALATFLRSRREALQPEDVGLPRGARRRTSGLRREEVAALCHMSTDYYSRLERERGPQPSEQMIAAIAQGLHLSLDERDHLFLLAGHRPPPRGASSEHVSPGMLRIFDRLGDTPAEIVTELGETLRQTAPAVALVGDSTRFTGPARSIGFRWFTDPGARALVPPEDHEFHSRMYASGLRATLALRGPDSRAARLYELLSASSEEFVRVWERHEVGVRPRPVKRYQHPSLGLLEVACQVLLDPVQAHALLVYTADAGSATHDRLRLLAAVEQPAG